MDMEASKSPMARSPATRRHGAATVLLLALLAGPIGLSQPFPPDAAHAKEGGAGKSEGKGKGNANGNANGKGNGKGNANGAAKGAGQGSNNGKGKGSGSGQGAGQASGAGKSSGAGSSARAAGSGGSGGSSGQPSSGGQAVNPSTRDRVKVDGPNVEVLHRNGMKETVTDGRYEMKDSRGRTIVNRPATGADTTRLRGMRG